MRGIFSDLHQENLVRLLEGKPTEVLGTLYDWVPLEFLTLRLVHNEPPSITTFFSIIL